MDSSWPENFPADRKMAIENLTRGREFANQLRLMLSKPFSDDGSLPPAKELVRKILGSLTETLSILNYSASDEVSQIPSNNHVGSPCWDGRKSEDSGESSKTSAAKDRRGCYKRRRTSQTKTILAPTSVDDGYAWRKYGQKVILNAKHPRNYYRCTHKFDQGCQATKQVQLTEDEPQMYRTTYSGHHTCKNLLKPPQIILDSTIRDTSILVSFGSNDNHNTKPNDSIFTSFPLIKQERTSIKEEMSSLNHNQSPPSDHYLLSSDLTTLESSGPMPGLSSASDLGDVYSCTASYHSLDIDMNNLESVNFDDILVDF
ncbi:WRKY DNA-binding transcription factor 70-like [Cornus florida]|uniref:WRKY DNA-binding transcription factor 70-like n=1 Tax=Cornus florida TaxID=4283 RepID=UPI00289D3A12|nr:WRKY DNA-binding transcription factor 70-like [Cornus florida]